MMICHVDFYIRKALKTYYIFKKNISCKAQCVISDSLFCFERRSGSFTEPISGSQHSDVIQALQPIMCGSEKFKCSILNVFLGFRASTSMCQSPVSLSPTTITTNSPPPENHISMLLVPLQAIRCQVTSAPAAGSCFSVPRCKFRASFRKWGTVSTSADCTQIKTSWPLQLICSTVKSERKRREF